MKPTRQIEACNLMASVSNFSSSYAKALLAASKSEDLKAPAMPRRALMTAADLALLEREMARLKHDFSVAEVSYGRDMLNLVIATRYISRLITNLRIERYLDDNYPEVLKEFKVIVPAASLEIQPAP